MRSWACSDRTALGRPPRCRCVAGILKPTLGQILINGQDVVQDQARAKSGLAFVPEVPSLYELLTVDEHLRFVAMCFNTMDRYEEIGLSLLDRYDLIEKKDNLVATLSKGMRQKLSVACALVHNANVLLFDEPMIGIDPAGARELKDELLREKGNGAAILISTHLLDTAEKLCDRVIIVSAGSEGRGRNGAAASAPEQPRRTEPRRRVLGANRRSLI